MYLRTIWVSWFLSLEADAASIKLGPNYARGHGIFGHRTQISTDASERFIVEKPDVWMLQV